MVLSVGTSLAGGIGSGEGRFRSGRLAACALRGALGVLTAPLPARGSSRLPG